MRSKDKVKQDVLAAIDARKDQLIAIGEQIWKNPEPGYREEKTSRLAAETLRSLGLDVTEKLALTGLRSDLNTGREGPVAVFPDIVKIDERIVLLSAGFGHEIALGGLALHTVLFEIDFRAVRSLGGEPFEGDGIFARFVWFSLYGFRSAA